MVHYKFAVLGKLLFIHVIYKGDRRSDENPQLAALHTLFLREHNRIAGILKKYNKYWDDEKLFQEARKIVIGELQHITYNEYVPCLVGQKAMADKNIKVKVYTVA